MRLLRTLAALLSIYGGMAAAQTVRFYQLDWYQNGGLPAQINSVWGRMTIQYPPQPQTHYLNVVVATNPNQPRWVIQNYPLRLNDNCDPAPRLEAVDFNLAELGFFPGQDVSNLLFNIQLTTMPVATYGAAATFTTVVAPWVARGYDWLQECPVPGPFVNPGSPKGHKAGPAVAVAERAVRDMNPVQEGDSQCCAGSMARSLDWLNRKNDLGFERTAQEIFDDLVAAGVSVPDPNLPRSREKWIKKKDEYAKQKSGNQIETKVWDGGDFVDPIPGVAEETGDFLEWLKAAWEGNKDIEIAYYYPGSAHIITVVDVYTQDGKTFVKYRDDEEQGDGSKGDSTVKEAQVYKGADGKWHFGSDENVIYFAVSEKCTKPAATAPSSFNPNEGVIFNGDVGSAAFSDDNYLMLLNDDLTLGCEGVFTGFSPVKVADLLTISMETQATRPGLALVGSAFNCQANSFFDVFAGIAPISDTLQTTALPPHMAWKFVNPMTGEMRFRVKWTPINDEDPAQDGWVLMIDLVAWAVGL